MHRHDIFTIPQFIISKEIIEFFGNKKVSIHYNFEWFNDNGEVLFKNINIDKVYTLSRADISKEGVKVCWLNEEIPENIQIIILEMLKIDISTKSNKPKLHELE